MFLKYETEIMGLETASERLATALELAGTGIVLMRQNLRRKWPNEDEEQLNDRLQTWLLHRRGSEGGDGPKFLQARRCE